MTYRQPEAKLVKDPCRKIAKAHGLLFENVESKSRAGWPDTCCGLAPRGRGIVHVEFKAPGRSPKVGGQQWRRIHEIRDNGGLATWCNSIVDFRDIIFNRDSLLLFRNEDGGYDL